MSTSLRVTSGDAYTGDRALVVTVVDPDGTATNLTGVALTFMVKRYFYDAAALITKTVGLGVTVAAPLTGLATIELEEADTSALDGRFLWELEADDAEGKVTLASGKFYVDRDLITA